MGDASLAIVSSTVSPLLPRIMRAASAADALLFGLSLTSYGRNFTGSSLRSTSIKNQRALIMAPCGPATLPQGVMQPGAAFAPHAADVNGNPATHTEAGTRFY